MIKKRVLLIDDEVPLTTLMRLNLVETGLYEVETVNQSSQALVVARAFRPDVILLDIVMPGLDGGDILHRLNEDRWTREVPILIMTALISTDETDGRGWVRSNGRVTIAKPVDFSRLNQIIGDVLAGRISSGPSQPHPPSEEPGNG